MAQSKTLKLGVGRRDLTPALLVGRCGFSFNERPGYGAHGRLFVTALVVDDGHGSRVAFLHADLHGGSRWFVEHLAARTAGLGLTSDRIFLSAAHTHNGPGPFYGHGTYDFVSGTMFPDERLEHFELPTATALLEEMIAATQEAVRDLKPGKLGYANSPAWGSAWNRSVDALRAMPSPSAPQAFSETDALSQPAPLTWPDYLERIAWMNPGLSLPDSMTLAVPPRRADPDDDDDEEEREDLQAALATYEDKAAPEGMSTTGADDRTLDVILARVVRGFRNPPFGLVPAAEELVSTATRLGFLGAPAGADHRGKDERTGDRGLVDARVHVLVATDSAGGVRAALAWFGATATLLGTKHALYNADVFGDAARRLERQLGGNVLCAFAGGTLGDANVVSPNRHVADHSPLAKDLDRAVALIAEASEPIAKAAARAVSAAVSTARDALKVVPTFVEANPLGAEVAGKWLAKHATFGPSALAGSEMSGSLGILHAFGYREGLPANTLDRTDPHAPKRLLPPMAAPPEAVPFRVVWVTTPEDRPLFAIAGAGFELSTALGREIADAVASARDTTPQETPVVVASLVGDFAGYAGNVWEYVRQHYEGASSVYGRWLGAWVAAQFGAVARAGPADPTGQVTFSSGYRTTPRRQDPLRGLPKWRFHEPLDVPNSGAVAKGNARRLVIAGEWRSDPPPVDALLWNGPRVERVTVGGRTLTAGGVAVTDVSFPMTLWYEGRKQKRWRLRALVDAHDASDGDTLEVHLRNPDGTSRTLAGRVELQG